MRSLLASNSAKSGLYRFGSFEFDPQTGELRKQGIRIRLEGQPVVILAMLLERPSELVTREDLQKKLWPSDTFVDFEQSLNAAVRRLRLALDDSADSPRYVETLTRRGYRWVAPVLGISGVEIDVASPGRIAVINRRPQLRKAVWIAIAGAGALAILITAWGLFRSHTGTDRVMLAVLPFQN